jgi:hypothetical protein
MTHAFVPTHTDIPEIRAYQQKEKDVEGACKIIMVSCSVFEQLSMV